MSDLKKCPFCGSKANFIPVGTTSGNGIFGVDFEIGCVRCGVTLPQSYELRMDLNECGLIEFIKDDRSIAINDWNRRSE